MNVINIEIQQNTVNTAGNNGTLFAELMRAMKNAGGVISRQDAIYEVGTAIGLNDDERTVMHETDSGLHNYLETHLDRLTTHIMTGVFGEYYKSFYKPEHGIWVFETVIDIDQVLEAFKVAEKNEFRATGITNMPNDIKPFTMMNNIIKKAGIVFHNGAKARKDIMQSVPVNASLKKCKSDDRRREMILPIVKAYVLNNTENVQAKYKITWPDE